MNTANGSRRRTNRLLMLLLVPGLLSAIVTGAGRYRAERSSRATELTLDFSELQTLSVGAGKPIPAILQRFKSCGITGVSVSEQLLGDLVSIGQVSYEQRPSTTGPLTAVRVPDKRIAKRVWLALIKRMAPGMVSPSPGRGKEDVEQVPNEFVVKAAPFTLNGVGIGLPPDAVEMAQRSGLDVVARLQNYPALNRSAIFAAWAELQQYQIKRIICSGEEVLGFKGLVNDVADELKSSGVIFGSIEFGKQRGDESLTRALDSDFIRVHSIPYTEMAGMTPSSAVERFVRAVKERGIRLCYVRLPETSGESPVDTDADFITSIRKQLESSGYEMKPAHPLGSTPRPRILLALMGLSVAAGFVLLLDSLVTMSASTTLGLVVLCALGASGLSAVAEKGRQIVALGSAVVFPTLGVAMIVGRRFAGEFGEKRPFQRAVVMFIGASAMTLCGALLIVGLLADRSYMVKLNTFMGIKAAHVLPMLAVMFFMIAGLPMFEKPLTQVRDEAYCNIRRAVSNPMFVWHALAVVVVMVVVGLAVLRTGNDPGMGVSPLELKFRSILDRVLVARPRTKEFMIGHPLMIVGIALLLSRRRNWGLPLIGLGVLGQASLLNTFCHIHTPLDISALHAVWGLVFGIIVAFVIWGFVSKRPDDALPK